ncbi:MAG: hypothetical protein KAV87_14215, partial [Desulfobacteraceae bacterium]|nr:hypothetical protein [Desulfobacteraceae bacterium]
DATSAAHELAASGRDSRRHREGLHSMLGVIISTFWLDSDKMPPHLHYGKANLTHRCRFSKRFVAANRG